MFTLSFADETGTALSDPWTGRTGFDLLNGRGWRVGTVEISLMPSDVTIDLDGRRLAVIDRTEFREWLIHPRSPLRADDLAWFTETGLTCLRIDGRRSYVVPDDCVGHLVAVV
jgi:hypothetical protein